MTMMMTTTLPVELIMEILSYLPAKSLISSCKFVCTSWRSVIKEPDFVKMHLNRGATINGGGGGGGTSSSSSSSNNNDYQSLICTSCVGKELFQLYPPFNFEDVPPNTNSDDHHTVTITPTKIDDVESFPFPYDSRSNIVGSCNGLLCIDNRGDERLVLLNLCTRRYKLSPKEPFPSHFCNSTPIYMPISYGFGCVYDSTTTTTIAEYKVVRIVYTYLTSKSEVKVYSMSTNSWRRVKDITDDDIHHMIFNTRKSSGLLLNGALHWMGQINPDIVCFDMRGEEFRKMPRPPPPDDANKDSKVLMIMRGCLCMVRIRESFEMDLDILVMKEYGVSKSWTREFVITLRSSSLEFPCVSSIVCLGDQILINKISGSLVLYDMNKKMSVYVQGNGSRPVGRHFVGRRFVYFMVPCIESLVSLKSSVLPLSKDSKRRMESLDTEIK